MNIFLFVCLCVCLVKAENRFMPRIDIQCKGTGFCQLENNFNSLFYKAGRPKARDFFYSTEDYRKRADDIMDEKADLAIETLQNGAKLNEKAAKAKLAWQEARKALAKSRTKDNKRRTMIGRGYSYMKKKLFGGSKAANVKRLKKAYDSAQKKADQGSFNIVFGSMSFAPLKGFHKASNILMFGILGHIFSEDDKKWPSLKQFVPELVQKMLNKLLWKMNDAEISGVLLIDTAYTFLTGHPIEVQNATATGWRSGIVAGINDDGSYNIDYNNEGFEDNVSRNLIRAPGGVNMQAQQLIRHIIEKNFRQAQSNVEKRIQRHRPYNKVVKQMLLANDFSNWVHKLIMYTPAWRRNDIKLKEIAIPGTHDSAAFGFRDKKGRSEEEVDTLITQSWNFEQQLHFGVRFFDIRLTLNEDGQLWTSHNGVLLELSFIEVMRIFARHVAQQKADGNHDFVLFTLKVEDGFTRGLFDKAKQMLFSTNKFEQMYTQVCNELEVEGRVNPELNTFLNAKQVISRKIADFKVSNVVKNGITIVFNDYDGGLIEETR